MLLSSADAPAPGVSFVAEKGGLLPFFVGNALRPVPRSVAWALFVSMPPFASLTDKIRAFAERVAAERDAYVVDVVVRGTIVDVFVDTDEGIGIDGVAKFSRTLGALVEEADLFPGRYTLNVSSPGATRPLVLPRQFPRHIGRVLRVQVRAPLPEAPPIPVEGTLTGVEGGALRLTPATGDPVVVPFDDLIEARVVLPW